MCSKTDKVGCYPPPLPIKQRRSACSGSSSTGSSVDMEPEGEKYSPLESLLETPSFSDVFTASTDCHAPECPIHHSAGHQERFFSESTAPPVPKKRLARALSLPGGCLRPQCSLPSRHQNYDNPLYMLSPIRDSQPEMERESQQPAFETPSPPRQPLSLLTFDTPDLQLPSFFKRFQDQEQVSLDIQECHLLFLKRIAQQLETLSLHGVETTIESFQPQDFQLCEGSQTEKIGDAVYYAVHCPKLPRSMFSAKVYRPNNRGSAAAFLKSLPSHINIQQFFVHFPQCPEPKRHASADDPQASRSTAGPRQAEEVSLELPDGGSTKQALQCHKSPEHLGRTVTSLLSEGYAVDVKRELPRGTLEDFIRDGTSLRCSQPQQYERQLGLILLQVAQGLMHLRKHGAGCAELQPHNVMLAWPAMREGGGAEVGMEEAGERGACGRRTKGLESGAAEGESLSAPIQALWKRWGPPRVVITTFQSRAGCDTSTDSEEVQLRRLLLLCLHLSEDPIPSTRNLQGSPFLHGLLQLAILLQDAESGVQMAEAFGILQVLLWGPQVDLFQQNQPDSWPILLANWLSVKRSLLVQKLSELALSKGDERPDHEDIMCLQYLSMVEPDSLLKITALLGLHHTAN